MTQETLTVEDRLIAGTITALAVGATVIVIPVILFVVSRGHALEFENLFSGFGVWIISVVLLAGALGMAVGSRRAVDLLTHFWGTARPRNLRLTLALWAPIVLVGIASHWLATA
jgi:hypothetical protein